MYRIFYLQFLIYFFTYIDTFNHNSKYIKGFQRGTSSFFRQRYGRPDIVFRNIFGNRQPYKKIIPKMKFIARPKSNADFDEEKIGVRLQEQLEKRKLLFQKKLNELNRLKKQLQKRELQTGYNDQIERYRREFKTKSDELTQLKHFSNMKRDAMKKLKQSINKEKETGKNLDNQIVTLQKDLETKKKNLDKVDYKFYNKSRLICNLSDTRTNLINEVENLKKKMEYAQNQLADLHIELIKKTNETGNLTKIQKVLVENRLATDYKYITTQILLFDQTLQSLELNSPKKMIVNPLFREFLENLSLLKESNFTKQLKRKRATNSPFGLAIPNSPVVKFETGLSSVQRCLTSKRIQMNSLRYDMINLINQIQEEKSVTEKRVIDCNEAHKELNVTKNFIQTKSNYLSKLTTEVNSLLVRKTSVQNETDVCTQKYQTLIKMVKDSYKDLSKKKGQLEMWKWKLAGITTNYVNLNAADLNNKRMIELKKSEYDSTLAKLKEALEFVNETFNDGFSNGEKQILTLQNKIKKLTTKVASVTDPELNKIIDEFESSNVDYFYHPSDINLLDDTTYSFFNDKKSAIDTEIVAMATTIGTLSSPKVREDFENPKPTATDEIELVKCGYQTKTTLIGTASKFELGWLDTTCPLSGKFSRVTRSFIVDPDADPPVTPPVITVRDNNKWELTVEELTLLSSNEVETMADIFTYKCDYGTCS
ncbi:hypothetical protein SNEBB_003155 [Seison nebaliae]|nr:hypothetical protein SNEBB_003155 [Seison nebaliae]